MKRFLGLFFFGMGLLLMGEAGLARSFSQKSLERQLTTFPCSRCHGGKKIRTFDSKASRQAHKVKDKHLSRGEKCTFCHKPPDFDQLVLRTRHSVSFGQSSVLCGQCHGMIKRDWDLGIHGKVAGGWRGPGVRWACVECHNPHQPTYAKTTTVAPPPIFKLTRGLHK